MTDSFEQFKRCEHNAVRVQQSRKPFVWGVLVQITTFVYDRHRRARDVIDTQKATSEVKNEMKRWHSSCCDALFGLWSCPDPENRSFLQKQLQFACEWDKFPVIRDKIKQFSGVLSFHCKIWKQIARKKHQNYVHIKEYQNVPG